VFDNQQFTLVKLLRKPLILNDLRRSPSGEAVNPSLSTTYNIIWLS